MQRREIVLWRGLVRDDKGQRVEFCPSITDLIQPSLHQGEPVVVRARRKEDEENLKIAVYWTDWARYLDSLLHATTLQSPLYVTTREQRIWRREKEKAETLGTTKHNLFTQTVFLTGSTEGLGGCLLYMLALIFYTPKIYVLMHEFNKRAIDR